MIQMDQVTSSDNPDSSNNTEKNVISFGSRAPNEIGSSWHVYSLFSWIMFISVLLYYLFGVKIDINNQAQVYLKQPLGIICLLVLNIMGLAITMKKTIYDKDQGFMNTYFGEQIKQQSIGFLSASGAFLTFKVINDIFPQLMYGGFSLSKEEDRRYIYSILGLIIGFSVIGMSCLVYSYNKITQLSEWYEIMIIKKGALSSVIGYLFYFMCLSTLAIGVTKVTKDKEVERWILSIVIIIPVINIIYSVSQKDLGMSLINLIIYIDLSTSFMSFVKEDDLKPEKIISLCVVGINFFLILSLIFSMRDKLIKA